ncbi:MAG TPA: hypothetical protein VEU30_07815 [Thermoanaerobaculia bacterium]|nr:hypothetical protein [Thermoanaerobaculia bacterium]
MAGSPPLIAIHCSRGGIEDAKRAVEAFRRFPGSVRDFIVIIRREEETVAYGEALRLSLARLEAEGKAARARVWTHRDDVLYVAFELMLERVRRALERWSSAMLDEQARIERTLGAAPVREVPFSRHELRIDAARLWNEKADGPNVGDVTELLLRGDSRRLHVITGTAGFGKTTTVMRAAREGGLQWLVIPAARIRRDTSNAQALFETAIDFEEVLAGASPEEKPIWQQIVGPVLKYLTQFQSGLGIIVDALDESVAVGRSYDLHTFLNFFRRAIVPVILTMRSEFWAHHRTEFVVGRSAVESTVQTLDVIELHPWRDDQILAAARQRLAETRNGDVRARVSAFIAEVETGRYTDLYGDIPRTPLFLRFILDVLERRDPRHVSRRDLFRYWAEQKIARDVDVPKARGGARLPIRAGVTTATETIRIATRAMIEAAVAMTEIRDGAVELLPYCRFEAIRDAMGADAPDSAEALSLNSLLITTSDAEPRLRFAHRVFQEFFLSEAADRFGPATLPREIEEWRRK